MPRSLQPAITFDTGDLGKDDHQIELGLIGSRAFGTFDLNARIGYERTLEHDDGPPVTRAKLVLEYEFSE